MLRLVRWLAYRDKVLEHVETLLVMYPRGRQFTRDYPGIRALIRSHFDEGASPAASALAVTARLIGYIVRQLSSEQFGAVSARLRTLDLGAMEPLIVRQISRRPEKFEHPLDFTTSVVGGALFMARRMAGEGSLDRGAHAGFLMLLDDIFVEADATPPEPLARLFALPEPPSVRGEGLAGTR